MWAKVFPMEQKLNGHILSKLLCVLIFVVFSFFISSCAYQFGYQSRKLPGGYELISIPVFENETQEVGVETYFSNALAREFEQSRVARVTNKNLASVTLKGRVTNVSVVANSQVIASDKSEELKYLPENTVLDTTYRLVVSTTLELQRNSDRQIIWSGSFSNERVFTAAQISVPGVNSVNPLYNHSAKHQNIELLAEDMMKDAHDRLTERF